MKLHIIIILSVLNFNINLAYGQSAAVLSGTIKNSKLSNLEIVLQKNDITRDALTIQVPVTNGKFLADVPVSKATYLYIKDGSNITYALVEPTDSIYIAYDYENFEHSLSFRGQGKEKCFLLNSISKTNLQESVKSRLSVIRGSRYPFDALFDQIDSAEMALFHYLDSFKTQMSDSVYSMMSSDIAGTVFLARYACVGLIYHEGPQETLIKRSHQLSTRSRKVLTNILDIEERKFPSFRYVNDVYTVLFMDYDSRSLSLPKKRSLSAKYRFLDSMLPLALKTPVLTLFLDYDIHKLNQSEELEKIMDKTYSHIEDSTYERFIRDQYENLAKFKRGNNAPDFTVEDQNGRKVSLLDFSGKVVYLDFWYAACGPCHALFRNLSKLKQSYARDPEIIFVCVSIDSEEVWKSALKKFKIDGTHVFTQNLKNEHQIITDYKVQAYPTALIIDKNSKIYLVNPSNDPIELKKELESAKDL